MAYLDTFSTTYAPCPVVNPALLKAQTMAHVRAAASYFDQHIIRTDDGCYWVADEGSYETLMHDLADRIVGTIPAGKSDES